MREMWQLPKRSVWKRTRRWLGVAALVWAVAAVPLTLWLVTRTPPPPESPPWRALTPVEDSAVRYGSQALRVEPVSLSSTVTSPMAQLQVEETVDPVRAVSVGVVRSGSHSAEMLAAGGKVLLRGGASFWSTLGVPTAEPGWVEVGDRLGVRVTFPLDQAAAAMLPGPEALMSTEEGATSTYRNGTTTAVFGDDGISTITLGDRTAAVSRPTGDNLAKLAGSPAPEWDKDVATLTGTGGALTVAPAVPPPPAPGEQPPAAPPQP